MRKAQIEKFHIEVQNEFTISICSNVFCTTGANKEQLRSTEFTQFDDWFQQDNIAEFLFTDIDINVFVPLVPTRNN